MASFNGKDKLEIIKLFARRTHAACYETKGMQCMFAQTILRRSKTQLLSINESTYLLSLEQRCYFD